MSNIKHVVSIELYHASLIVITVDCNNQDRLHIIIIDMEIPSTQYNIAGLLDTIQNTPCESIHSNLKSI
jgi:hypothetical protein